MFLFCAKLLTLFLASYTFNTFFVTAISLSLPRDVDEALHTKALGVAMSIIGRMVWGKRLYGEIFSEKLSVICVPFKKKAIYLHIVFMYACVCMMEWGVPHRYCAAQALPR